MSTNNQPDAPEAAPQPRPREAFPIHEVMATLRATMPAFQRPLIDQMGVEGTTPFHILIATILSLRTKDTLTAVVAPRLFAAADTPEALLALGEERIAELIYPVGFYRNKARSIVQICRVLIERYDGAVPADLDALLALPGVGRKTANLVLTAGFGLPGICVDIHVHRICNRWGYVQTKNPDETEQALRARLPPRILDRDQWSAGDPGAEHLPAGVATLLGMPGGGVLRARGRDAQPVARSVTRLRRCGRGRICPSLSGWGSGGPGPPVGQLGQNGFVLLARDGVEPGQEHPADQDEGRHRADHQADGQPGRVGLYIGGQALVETGDLQP